ncbi:MAG: exopolysaccharide Pel transporter PelG [Methylococcales bacterium]|nr:exopolysaccharide Pel transporter PelG [Methylococcales bacterium]
MAGIGFELRKLLRKDSYLGLIQAYGYAGIIGSGPWVLSIVGVMSIGVLSTNANSGDSVISFLISVTYLIGCSLIFGAWLQLMLTRYMSDLIFSEKNDEILPNLLGALLVTTVTSLVFGLIVWPFFAEESLSYRLLMLSNLVILSNIWILVIMLSGLRAYQKVLGVFFLGYGLTVVFALLLKSYGIIGLLLGFMLGQSVMMYVMLALMVNEYDATRLLCFDFLDKNKVFYSLAAISVIYNLGVWMDKIVFWFNPLTSEVIIGPLRSAVIYDPPIFLAYLSTIPGMAVFLLRMEADFVDKSEAFYGAIREGAPLAKIRTLKASMIATVRLSFVEIFKVQGITAIALIYMADDILTLFNISTNYSLLFSIDVAAVGVQVILLGVFNVLFYLDKRYIILGLCSFFALANLALTLLSQHLGASFYGYGFAVAIFMTTFAGFVLLDRKLIRLEYETFMLQR